MRLAGLVLVACAGCSDGYDVWVEYKSDLMTVVIFDSSCNVDEPPPGVCRFWTDGNAGWPCKVSMQCSDSAHLEKEGVTVATGGLGFANPPLADTLVIDGCSKEMRIALPALPEPPTITGFDGSAVSWRLNGPADRVTVYGGTGFVGSICGQSPSTTAATLPDPHRDAVGVIAWSPLKSTDVALGEAHVRSGAGSNVGSNF